MTWRGWVIVAIGIAALLLAGRLIMALAAAGLSGAAVAREVARRRGIARRAKRAAAGTETALLSIRKARTAATERGSAREGPNRRAERMAETRGAVHALPPVED